MQFTAPGAGLQTATLGATASIGGTAPNLSLSGNGQRPALLTAVANSNNFGTVLVGVTSGSVPWTVTNGGDVPTGVPALNNGDPGEVLVGANTCTAALAPGASCTIAVSFSAAAAGARSGILTLAATRRPVTFTASATGQTAAGLALAPATGSSTGFGNVLVGAAVTQAFVLANTGQQATGAVTIT